VSPAQSHHPAVESTEAGRKYYDRCRHILDEVTDLEAAL